MHLKAITMKGFKSFPDRTRLDFGEGVSVVVGPNGSGKSNITDAVLWALGEQSPLAVRGQSMQDVIFAGGRGVQARSEAEVELLLDNSDGAVDVPATELSIIRRLNRAGEGEYRMNGARCRLIDVLEVLSDTGMGKEAHSVISQGRVESIVTSKPRERRMLIEEAAGLGKHRKRRRRAQLKLDRTRDNLDRLLDIEREARSRLRPLKRQAEAAELHERLERQSLEARWQLAADALRGREARLAATESAAAGARAARAGVESELEGVAGRREEAEKTLADRSARHDELARRAFRARSAADRVGLRLDQAVRLAETLAARALRRDADLTTLRAEAARDDATGSARVGLLEAELARLDADRAGRLESELAGLSEELAAAQARTAELTAARAEHVTAVAAARQRLDEARGARRQAESEASEARRAAAQVGAELAAVNQFLHTHNASSGDVPALDGQLEVARGYELAVAAALGGRLGAAVVADRAAAAQLLDRSGLDGGRALVLSAAGDGAVQGPPPAPGAEPLLALLGGPANVLAIARRLLADAWVVDDLAALADDFSGIAVTRAGRLWIGASGELRQIAAGGRERALEQRNRRDALVAGAERAANAEQDALGELAAAEQAVRAAEDAVEAAEMVLRDADRARAESIEAERRTAWLIDQRRAAPEHGELAVRRAQLAGELGAERRALERVERDRLARDERIAALVDQASHDGALKPDLARLRSALDAAGAALAAHAVALEGGLEADRAAGDGVATELRSCAAEEAGLQARLRVCGEAVTTAEVAAQQARDQAAETRAELEQFAVRLGLEAAAAANPLSEDERLALEQRVERLARRREQLGPVNPLAADEYHDAVERAEELESQRADLEAALRELRALIRDTDRQIAESFEQTFTAAARNFEELVEHVFPGGRGRLALVKEDAGPRPVLGGQADAAAEPATAEASAEAEAEAQAQAGEGLAADELLGVEIEVTPAGKSMKRLSLLSGGEKSMTAIAFLFAVFLARPCPFYILDEVEAALDDLNIDRFLALLRRYSSRAQFIVVTHQKRTMEAADWLYGVSMGGDGVSKIVSRRLVVDGATQDEAPPLTAAGAA